jgi:hypothetical protein
MVVQPLTFVTKAFGKMNIVINAIPAPIRMPWMISRKMVLFEPKLHMKLDFMLIKELYAISAMIDQECSHHKPQTAADVDSLYKVCEGDSTEHGSDLFFRVYQLKCRLPFIYKEIDSQ